ncbi:MAG TPA: hypothetical protein VMT19_12700 [Thermoanaerobaculaceae bacterium]|nr:hypothetical protein [Thermoanaerobaculaceae bacterium]
MEKHEAVLAELEQMREGAAALIRAKLEAVARQTRELANRLAGDLDVVVPPDLEALFPIGAVADHLRSASAPPAAAPALGLDVLRKLDLGRAQSEVLQELLRQVGPWCGPRAIIVLRDGTVQGWAGGGFPFGDPARTWRANLADSPTLTKASAGTPVLVRPAADKVLSGWFDGSEKRLLLVPMLLRGKIVGVLAALEGETGLDTAVIQQLTYTVGLMLETLATRVAAPNPSLSEPQDLTGGPAAPVTGAPLEAPPPAPVFEAPRAAVEAAPEVAPEVAAAPVDAGSTVQLAVPVIPAVPAVPAPPVAPVRTPEEERRHEEARRFARLLVSEIRLYNEQAVQSGKLAHDIYKRLKEDIDRSRDMYEQRVSAEVRANSNYFHDEMVRILADGDPEALGM